MSDNKRKLRSSGSTSEVSLDKTKTYKFDTTGALVEATTIGDTDIVFTGSKSSLRRIADLERNVSILAAKSFTTDAGNNEDVGQVEYALKSGKWSTARTLTLTGAVTGSVSVDGSGNVSLATTATSDPVITLTGDVSGSGTMTNLGNVSIAATIQPNSVALGTDTTGNYMINVSGGTGITVSHTQSEGSTATVAVDTTTIATRAYADAAAAVVQTAILGGAGAAYDTLQELKALIDAGDASLTSAISNLTIGNGTFTVTAGSGMTGGGTLGTANQTGNSSVTITNADKGSAQAIFKNVAVSGQTTIVADSNNDTLTFAAGTGMTLTTDATTDTLTINGPSVGNGIFTVTAGSGMTGGGTLGTANQSGNSSVTLSHADTSAVASLTALTGANVVSDIDVDDFGHVTGLATRTMTLADLGYTGATNAQPNQNAFSNVAVSGQTTVAADSATDTLTLAAGSGISIATNATTDTVTITNSITNLNQLTNGPGYVTSSGVTSVATGNGLTGGTITGTGTLSMSGSYTGTFTVTGDIRATGEVTAYYSDSRLKTNVQSIDNALSKVMAINGYTYDSSELAMSLGLPKHMDQIGLMADEVEAVMPELVTQSAIEGYKTIRYDKVVSVLVNAVKEQQAQIEELQALVKKTLH